MDWNDIKGIVGSLAPTIATALGGPLAGSAVAALGAVFGLKDEGTFKDRQESIVAALSGATPDQLLALKKADQDYAVRMQELGFKNIEELEKLAAGDRDSARKREIEVKDNTPKVLAYALVLGFFSVLGFMLFANVPTGSRDLLNIMLGMLGTSFVSVTAYYFGSSSGSAEKTRLLANSIPASK
jgi:hypothetical protein